MATAVKVIRWLFVMLLVVGCSQSAPTLAPSQKDLSLTAVGIKEAHPVLFALAVENHGETDATATRVHIELGYRNLITNSMEGVPPEFDCSAHLVEKVAKANGKSAIVFELHWNYPSDAPPGLAFIEAAFSVEFDNGETLTTKRNSFVMETADGVFEKVIDGGTMPEAMRGRLLETLENLGGKRSGRIEQLQAWAELANRS